MQLETARHQMIYHQVRPWDVTDRRVLDALSAVPREDFVAAEYQSIAFTDTALPLDCGQSMLKPVLEGRLLQHLDIQPEHRVLIVGTGSGFLTGCVAQLADQVISLELYETLSEQAARKLAALQIRNVELLVEDYLSYTPSLQFDRILLTGALETFDPRLPEWLTTDGKALAIVGQAPAMTVDLITRDASHFMRHGLFETVVPQLDNQASKPQFSFTSE